MKIFTYNYKFCFVLVFMILCIKITSAQNDTTHFFHRNTIDTSSQKLNMDAVYNRPFLVAGKIPIAIGGYLEINTQYASTDGISEGFSFQARRFTLFFSSTIAKKIKLLSELEFEDGTKEINLEFAAVDIEFNPLVNLRGGILMNPIGAFNQNHDGPRWDFIDRPISATSIIPSTLSNAGFGLHGKYFFQHWILGYEVYLTNGFDDNIISNSEGKTSLAAGKLNPSRFEENNSGLPTFTGKIAIRNRRIGEIGISYLTGVYNQWNKDGIIIDSKRSVSIVAVDFNTTLLKSRLSIIGEFAKVFVDVPEVYTQQYGKQQFGGYVDFVSTVLKRTILGWENAKLNFGIRLEYVDYNQGEFAETNQNIGDHLWSFVPSIAFRPAGTTVIRFNYRYQQQTDFIGNLPSQTGIILFGLSSYF